ncbi:long-chain fatty acid--CoA ligase [Halococcus dombrowskii]|uniref:Long-chain fatty acid--CoA ligase n=2 Tax=Halococcus dombrowskii TaxID=179637 RepID=A0AAX3APQ3_HALDO|nr:long-chain fatty acid--CoA ligase [Halococcus dombrowskii]UOO94478.1 long-chain fatty acid--CoA ligase [Halococcus dombrowskii]
MDVQLTLGELLDRAVRLFPDREIVTKQPDGDRHRYTYGEAGARINQLAHALDELGVESGERVATVALNHYRHFELYFAPPCSGRSIHMCNMRLPDEHFQYIINDAADRVVFVDPAFIEKIEANADAFETVEQYVVLADDVPKTSLSPVVAYEDLIEGQPTEYDWPAIDESDECGTCYTSGTTGKPKGVSYSHRGVYLHSMMSGHTDTNGISQRDTVLPVVPMFHANGWGVPYAATFVGAKQVLPGVHTDPGPVAELIDDEGVTMSAAVPTIWLEMAEYLDDNPDVDISNIDRLTVGGAAPPESLIRRYDEEYDAPIIQGWGMTETSPLGTMSTLRKELEDRDPEERYAYRAKAGIPVPGFRTRIIDDDDEEVPADDETMGELTVRAPWVADTYHDRPSANRESFTEDGWLRTGDIATHDEQGYIDIVDRTKDVIKSGGEWISSVELENELMAHDAVTEATVIAVAHEKWQERPLACVVTGEHEVTADELRDHLGERFPDWWLPDEFEFLDEIPRTSTGKFDKMALRERLDDATVDTKP